MARTTAVRANAVRQAREARAAREAERARREQAIEAALVDFFEHQERATELRADADRRAKAIVSDAATKASADDQAARDAMRRLRELVGSHGEAAELTGLSVNAVRGMLQDRAAHATTESPQAPQQEPGRNPAPVVATPGSEQRLTTAAGGEHEWRPS